MPASTSPACADGPAGNEWLPKPLKQQQSGNPGPEQKAQSGYQVIKVTMRTSRKEVTGERSCGLYADLENVATEPVTIYPLDTVLVIRPEVTQTSACVYAELYHVSD